MRCWWRWRQGSGGWVTRIWCTCGRRAWSAAAPILLSTTLLLCCFSYLATLLPCYFSTLLSLLHYYITTLHCYLTTSISNFSCTFYSLHFSLIPMWVACIMWEVASLAFYFATLSSHIKSSELLGFILLHDTAMVCTSVHAPLLLSF